MVKIPGAECNPQVAAGIWIDGVSGGTFLRVVRSFATERSGLVTEAVVVAAGRTSVEVHLVVLLPLQHLVHLGDDVR